MRWGKDVSVRFKGFDAAHSITSRGTSESTDAVSVVFWSTKYTASADTERWRNCNKISLVNCTGEKYLHKTHR